MSGIIPVAISHTIALPQDMMSKPAEHEVIVNGKSFKEVYTETEAKAAVKPAVKPISLDEQYDSLHIAHMEQATKDVYRVHDAKYKF